MGQERRAKEMSCVYTEMLYRELYRHYELENRQHITEIQFEVE